MKKIDGIQIKKQIFRYGNNVFQTDGGFLLKFVSGAENWQGMFPGCSWDRFYDEILINLSLNHINKRVFKQRRCVPTLIFGSDVGSCTRCSDQTDYKFCSISCWYFGTLDVIKVIIAEADTQEKIDRNVDFVKQMAIVFGKQVDEEQASLVQLGCDTESTS